MPCRRPSRAGLDSSKADILLGGGEWAVGVLQAENPDLDWVLSDQAGLIWSQSLPVFETSSKKDLAIEFVQYIMSPGGQARLATSS